MELLFEHTMRMFLGEKAFHIAGCVYDEKERRKWLRKAMQRIQKAIDVLDTTTKHKELLSSISGAIFECLKKKGFPENDETRLSLLLFRLSGLLLGFVSMKGGSLYTATYHQTSSQYYTEMIFQGGDVMQDYYDKKSAISIRKDIVKQLKDDGKTYFEIALVLNTTEYEVKKLYKGL